MMLQQPSTPCRPTDDKVATDERQARTIFVAEDDNDFRDYLADLLVRRGYRVKGLKNGRELLAAVQSETASGAPLGAVIADHRMPQMGGMAVLEALAALGVAGRFVLISAFVDDGVADRARALGAAAVLAKPFGHKELLAALTSALNAPPGAQCHGPTHEPPALVE